MVKKIFLALSRQERGVLFLALATIFVSGAAIAILVVLKTTKTVPTQGGEYTEGMLGQPSYINPVLAANEVDRALVELVFDNITTIAEKVATSTDGKTWNVRLKEGLLWHDGKKLTSDDVIFTIGKVRDPDSQSPLTPAWQGITVQRISELELQLQLPAPYAFFDNNLCNLYIMPKHLFADIPAANWRLSEYNLRPIGSGPYRFESYDKQPDGFIAAHHFAANPSHEGGKPLINNFAVRFFVHGEDLLKSFNAGQIDGVAGASPEMLARINRPYTLHTFATPSYYAVFFNQTQNPALKDIAVREALIIVVDKDDLVKNVLGGHGRIIKSPLPETTASTSSALSAKNAEVILDSAGWHNSSSTPLRVKIVGQTSTTLQFTLLAPQVEFLKATANTLKTAWEKIGAAVTVSLGTPEEIAADAVKNRDYDMLLFGNILNPPADLFPFWHSSQRFYPGLNLSIYNNKKADALMEAVRENLNAQEQSKKLRDLEQTIIADAPAVFLYSPDYLYVATKNLGGIEQKSINNPADRFKNVSTWYVKTARALKRDTAKDEIHR